MTSEKMRIDRRWGEYPIGTLAHAVMGGHWERKIDGWRWNGTGPAFQTPGGDAVSVTLPTPPASHDAGEAVAEVYSHQSRDMCKVSTLHARFSRSVPVGTKLYPESALAALTAEVAMLTGELDAASARLHEVATLCATVEQERDHLTAELEEVREQRNRIAATMTGELEKEKAQSRHLAGAVSRKIEDLIAVENQCGYYKMQYSRAEQVRKEACEANVKAQAAMLWLEADIARSRQECERLRGVLEAFDKAARESGSIIGFAGKAFKLITNVRAALAAAPSAPAVPVGDGWNRGPFESGVPAGSEMLELLRHMVALHTRTGIVLTTQMRALAEMLPALPAATKGDG